MNDRRVCTFSAIVSAFFHDQGQDGALDLERFVTILDQSCFSDGETIHAEGGEVDAFPSSDAA